MLTSAIELQSDVNITEENKWSLYKLAKQPLQ